MDEANKNGPAPGDAAGRASYLVSVQVLRFVAAALVMAGHVQHEIVSGKAGPAPGFRPIEPFDLGLGVDIFFVISGFIMAHLTRGDFGRPGAPRRFLLRRIARVVPIYYLFTALTLLAVLLAPDRLTSSAVDGWQILASFLFLPWPGPIGIFPVLSLGWTLNYEMFFYGAFALALLLPRRLGLPALAIAFVALTVAAPFSPGQWFALRFWGDPIVCEFLLGIGLAELYRRGARLPVVAAWGLVIVGLAYVTLMHGAAWRPASRLLALGPGAVLIAAGAILVRPSATAPSGATRALAAGGDASYALYLTHPFSIKALSLLWVTAGLSSGWIFAATASVAAIATSLAVHRGLELPVNRRVLALLTGPAGRPRPAALETRPKPRERIT